MLNDWHEYPAVQTITLISQILPRFGIIYVIIEFVTECEETRNVLRFAILDI